MGGLLWENLPNHVASLNLGLEVSITRSDKELRMTPLDRRETWDLEKIDQYAGRLSESIMQKWTPIFPQEKPK